MSALCEGYRVGILLGLALYNTPNGAVDSSHAFLMFAGVGGMGCGWVLAVVSWYLSVLAVDSVGLVLRRTL